MNRKEWLEQQIKDLTLTDLFTELSEQEKTLLDIYTTELKVIKLLFKQGD